MSVKCVFYVQSVTDTASGVGQVKATPVAKGPYGDYSKYTPTGLLEFNCLNDVATAWFREHIGKDIVLEIREPTDADLIVVPTDGSAPKSV